MQNYKNNTGTFIGKGGIEIFFQSWVVDKPKAVLVISHGQAEHSGRYTHILDELKGKGISVYALDHRGHGRSGGKRGHVDAWMDYIYDLKLFLNFVKEDNDDLPVILMGHSMGGLIALKFVLTYPDDIDALILSSAMLTLAAKVPAWKSTLGPIVSKYLPRLSMPTGLDVNLISHDKNEVSKYLNDPMIHGVASARWLTEYVVTRDECYSRASEIKIPTLIFHGTDDGIVDYRGSERIFEAIQTPKKDKALHIFTGLFHETMNELEKDRTKVLHIVARWIAERASKRKRAAAANKAKSFKPKKPAPKKTSVKKPVKKKIVKKKR